MQDVQGSTRALTDTLGSVTDTYAYTAFGDLHAQTGTTVNPYLYTGQRYDATTEQYYLRAREYDPAVGRFLSRDTWALDTWNPVELNRYVYVAANPIMWSDPSGNEAIGYEFSLFFTGGTTVSSMSELGITLLGAAALVIVDIMLVYASIEIAGCLLKDDLKKARGIGRAAGIPPELIKEWGKYIEAEKGARLGRDLTTDELWELAEEFLKDKGLWDADDEDENG